jgi:predicted Fe-Mo cluster-binding NifX family protein
VKRLMARLYLPLRPTVSEARRDGLLIVCVTASEVSLDAPCEEHFGRAPVFILMDTDSGEWRAVENRYPGPCGGTVPGGIRILADHGVQVLITGRVGGSGQEALESAGIRIHIAPAETSVMAALALFREGSLARLG